MGVNIETIFDLADSDDGDGYDAKEGENKVVSKRILL